MSRTLDHPKPEHARALRMLDRVLTTPAEIGNRLFIPRPEGLLRHIPGNQVHIMPEVFLVEQGVNFMDFPAERHALGAGEICVLPRGMPHCETRPRKVPFCMLVFMFEPHRVHFHFSMQSRRSDVRDCRTGGGVETGQADHIARTIDTLVQIPRARTEWHRETSDALCFSILSWLGAALRSESRLSARYSPRIEQVINLVATNLQDPQLGTAALAEWVGCTPDYLSTRFRRETGSSLTRYLNRERLHKAQFLLVHSPMILKEVAAVCGFSNAHYFSRVFRATLGCSPRQWRSNAQGRKATGRDG